MASTSSSKLVFFLPGVPMVGVLGRGRVQKRGAAAQLQESQLETETHLRRQDEGAELRCPSQLQAHLVRNLLSCLGCHAKALILLRSQRREGLGYYHGALPGLRASRCPPGSLALPGAPPSSQQVLIRK